jgi:hypothetical protein
MPTAFTNGGTARRNLHVIIAPGVFKAKTAPLLRHRLAGELGPSLTRQAQTKPKAYSALWR